MSQTPKVSVIIPVYNTEPYLCQCLDSVVNQTLRDIEIICVDDGSADRSYEILASYAAKDRRFTLLRQPNSGSGKARNKGILSAKGEYVVFMDADDLYPETTTLEKLYTAAIAHDATICGGSFSSFRDGNMDRIVRRYSGPMSGYTFLQEGEVLYTDYQFDFGYHRFLYRRSFLLDNGILFPDYRRFQDPPFFVKAMITARKFYAICDATYLYREQPRNIAADERKSIDAIRGLTDNMKMALENDLPELYRLTVARCQRGLFWPALLTLEKSDSAEAHAALRELNRVIDVGRLYGDLGEAYKLHIIRDYELLHDTRRELRRELDCVRRELDCVRRELDCVRRSASYRIGRTITWLPRKIRGGVRCLRDNGPGYTFRRVLYHMGLWKDEEKE